MTRLYTKLGDDGSTGLLFGGRVRKTDPVIEAVGSVDEAVAALGVARSLVHDAAAASLVLRLQRDLFVVGADLAANPAQRSRLVEGTSAVTGAMVEALEHDIDQRVAGDPLRPVFVVPGASPESAALDVARTAVRRAERRAVDVVDSGHHLNPAVLLYLNRLSDLLYVLARDHAGQAGEPVSHD